MKKLLAAIALAVFTPNFILAETPRPPAQKTAAEAAPAETETRISAVIVFPGCAKITRSALVPAGTREIVLRGFPESAFNFSAETKFPSLKISSLDTVRESFETPAGTEAARAAERVRAAEIAAASIGEQLKHARGELEKTVKSDWLVPELEKEGKFDVPAALALLKQQEKTADFYATKAEDLAEKFREAGIELELARSELSRVKKQNTVLETRARIRFLNPADVPAEISVSYFIADAAWAPSYDILVSPENKTVELVSLALIRQSGGEDWTNVPVELSTADPLFDADIPEFDKIAFSEKVVFEPKFSPAPAVYAGGPADRAVSYKTRRASGGKASQERPRGNGLGKSDEFFEICRGNAVLETLDGKKIAASKIALENGLIFYEDAGKTIGTIRPESVKNVFVDEVSDNTRPARIPPRRFDGSDHRFKLGSTTILSDGKFHRRAAASEKYTAEFFHKIVPAKNKNAYRIAEIQNAGFRPLFSGPAKIFFGSEFVGEMVLPHTVRNGKVRIPLGVNPDIAVSRETSNFTDSAGTFVKSRQKKCGTTVKITNNSAVPARVVVEDVVPRSNQEEIKISGVRFSPKERSFSETDGRVVWDEEIAPAGTLEISNRFQIDFPENFVIEE